MDVQVSPQLRIPSSELGWRFSRSSGPGGQHVNTSDSRVELLWDIYGSKVLTDEQRQQLVERLGPRLTSGTLTVSASEQRSQLRNREIAVDKLAELLASALAPAGPQRRATKPTQGSKRRRLAAKGRRSDLKAQRRRPTHD
ncbi:alternative ribosome rescue aminoacyl-tRNA hydrolase ArfB [Arthrobacter rhombi]|uniref:alternative ribosome rescue aminoacyl-tRNA hydrolase ArfB n=1 Tax=Arthrobacter rhombi TaxID=71253 RepID=UPI0031E02D09